MVNSKKPIQKAGLTALLALSMAGVAQSGFAQMSRPDSVKTSFASKESWLSLRAGAGFNSSSDFVQAPEVNLGVEIKTGKNFSITAGVISNFMRGIYSNQSKYLATPQGLVKENYLCLKYGVEQKIGQSFSFTPSVNAGVHRMKSMAQNAPGDLNPGIGAAASLEYHPLTTTRGRNVFLELKAQVNQMFERSPMQGMWFGMGTGIKLGKRR